MSNLNTAPLLSPRLPPGQTCRADLNNCCSTCFSLKCPALCCLKESERVLTFAVWFSVMGLPRSRAVHCGESFQDLRQKNIIRADCSHFQLLPNLIDKETKNATTSERESRAVITAGSSSLCGDLYLEL